MPVPWEEVMVVFSPAERAEIERGAAEIVAQNRALRALRKSLGVTQNQLAEALEPLRRTSPASRARAT